MEKLLPDYGAETTGERAFFSGSPVVKIASLVFIYLSVFFSFQTQAQDEDVMFQAFDWNVQNQPPGLTWYGVLDANKQIIADAGIDLIWMPPPSNSAAPQGYLPRELYDLNSAYGSQQALLCSSSRISAKRAL